MVYRNMMKLVKVLTKVYDYYRLRFAEHDI